MKALAILIAVLELTLIPACTQTTHQALPPDRLCEFHKKNPSANIIEAMLGESCIHGDRVACDLLVEMIDGEN